MSAPTLTKLTAEKLKEPGTYLVSAVVGTVINVYGQLLVPWLRGSEDPWQNFLRELTEEPAVTSLSVGLGYLFPVIVGVYSSVSTRWRLRHLQ